jgi:hypothetical protein
MVDVNPTLTRGGLDAVTLVAGMAGKPIAEGFVSPLVGNGTFISGALKMIIAVMAQKAVPGKVGDIATIAFGADGAEDLLLAIRGGRLMGPAAGGEEVDF